MVPEGLASTAVNIFETARNRWENREISVTRLYDEFLRGIV